MASTSGNTREKLTSLAKERILVLDGATGSLIQAFKNPSGQPLAEDDYRGERFKDHPRPLKGCNDILCLTQPQLIFGIHAAYLKAGADIIETCSFNATALSLADYDLEALAYEVNVAAAGLARKAADSFSTPEKPRFVAGVMGPTAKSASICQDMNTPERRAIGWDGLEAAYYDNARGLLDGGADLILIETIFDTLNAKAAIFAVQRLAKERGIDVPLMISATVSNTGGRLLSGQTTEAFCISVLHANPLALGLNCSFGAEKLKPHIASISAAAPCLVSAHPNAGLPNHNGDYDESPESMANHIEEYLREGLVNIIGGCCGSTPDHIAAIAEKAKNYSPRKPQAGTSIAPQHNEGSPAFPKKILLAGLEPLEIKTEHIIAMEKEDTKTDGNSKSSRLILSNLIEEGNYEDAVDTVLEAIESGPALVDICIDDTSPSDITCFLNSALIYPDIARAPIMISGSRWELIKTGLKCLPGKSLANFININFKDGDAEFLCLAQLAHAYGAAVAASSDTNIIAFFEPALGPV